MNETSHPSAPDSALIARAQRGEAEAFGELYERYLDPIYRYLYSWAGNSGDAEDLTETVFLRAYQALPRYQDRGLPFSAFLYRVARNVLVDHHRLRRDEAPIEEAELQGGSPREMDETLIRRERAAALKRTLTALPPDYGEVIRLRLLLGLPTETVAAWMGRSQGAARILLFRALKALRQRLTDEHGSH